MELLFVVMGSALIGAGLHWVLPGRKAYGSALLLAISASVSTVVWAGLTWLGWRFDGGWIWVVSLLIGPLVAIAASRWLVRRRHRMDEELFARLSKA